MGVAVAGQNAKQIPICQAMKRIAVCWTTARSKIGLAGGIFWRLQLHLSELLPVLLLGAVAWSPIWLRTL